MKTMTQTFDATSKNHGTKKITLRFTIKETTPRAYIIYIECLTDGFRIGGQTTGHYNERAQWSIEDNNLVLYGGKKSLARLGTHHIYLFKDSCGAGKDDRFFPFIHPINFDPSPLTREAEVEKYTVKRSQDDGEVYVLRNISPRFTAKYRPDGQLSNFEFMSFEDELPPDPARMAKLMRGLGLVVERFLQNEEYERRKKRE